MPNSDSRLFAATRYRFQDQGVACCSAAGQNWGNGDTQGTTAVDGAKETAIGRGIDCSVQVYQSALARAKALATNLFFLALILSPGSAGAAQGADQASGIEDVIATRHLVPVGDLYTDGKSKFLCVQTKDGKFALWDPADGALSNVSDNKKCEVSSELHEVRFIMTNGKLYCDHLPANCEARFSNGKIYSATDFGAPRGGPLFDYYYRVIHSDGTSSEFYLLRKSLKPRELTYPDWYDSSNGKARCVTLNYDVPLLESVDVGYGKTLLYSYGYDDSTVPVMLLVSKLPDRVWSSAGAVFLIPKQLLPPAFIRSGWNLTDQYNAFLQIMGEPTTPSDNPQKPRP